MAQKTRAQLKIPFRQGAWPQSTDYEDLIDSFALVGEIPESQGVGSRQQVVTVPAGAVTDGVKYPIVHNMGKYPCVTVCIKQGDALMTIDGVTVYYVGTTRVDVLVRNSDVDVASTGMTVIIS